MSLVSPVATRLSVGTHNVMAWRGQTPATPATGETVNLFMQTYDDLTAITREAGGIDNLSIDQKIQIAQVMALLSVSQELSLIQDQGINPEWSQNRD
jgi:hypothetical protein